MEQAKSYGERKLVEILQKHVAYLGNVFNEYLVTWSF